jgi:formylglycine-generating enzyme required for sulfatase activity
MIAAALAVHIAAGAYRTPFPATADEPAVHVDAFWLDRTPVTNADFLGFVTAHPQWRRDRIKPVLADAGYLANWAAPAELGATAPANAPVVDVSWFAARAYCAARGGRLPTEAEWELAAAGTPDDLAWYEAPAPATLPAVGGAPDARGISDLHGLVWEWVEDFGASGVGVAQCGAATPAEPVASTIYLRYAFRTSLDATFAIGSLGFRCAYDEVKP